MGSTVVTADPIGRGGPREGIAGGEIELPRSDVIATNGMEKNSTGKTQFRPEMEANYIRRLQRDSFPKAVLRFWLRRSRLRHVT